MNFKNMLRRSKLTLPSLCMICSFLLAANFKPAHAQTLGGETLNTKEAKRDREMGFAMLKDMKKILVALVLAAGLEAAARLSDLTLSCGLNRYLFTKSLSEMEMSHEHN